MSYNNLEIYDKQLLNNHGTDYKVFFFCNFNFSYNKIDGVIIKKIFNYSNQKHILKILSYFYSLLNLLFWAFKEKPKIIHVQWYRAPLIDYIIYGLMKVIFTKSKFIHTAHNILPHNYKQKHIKQYKKLYSLSDCIIIHTQSSEQELLALLDKKKRIISVIPHGILEYKIAHSSQAENFKDIRKRIESDKMLVFSLLGSLNRYKGVDLLSEVWNNTPRLNSNKNTMLIIAGKGFVPEIEKLKRFDNVFIKNEFLPDAEFMTLLSLTNVLVLPYRKISQSGILLTAISQNKPIIVSKIGGLCDPFQFGKTGWMIEPNNFDDLQKTMIHIADNRQNVDMISNDKKLWEKLKGHYDWGRIQRMTFNLYKDLMN